MRPKWSKINFKVAGVFIDMKCMALLLYATCGVSALEKMCLLVYVSGSNWDHCSVVC